MPGISPVLCSVVSGLSSPSSGAIASTPYLLAEFLNEVFLQEKKQNFFNVELISSKQSEFYPLMKSMNTKLLIRYLTIINVILFIIFLYQNDVISKSLNLIHSIAGKSRIKNQLVEPVLINSINHIENLISDSFICNRELNLKEIVEETYKRSEILSYREYQKEFRKLNSDVRQICKQNQKIQIPKFTQKRIQNQPLNLNQPVYALYIRWD